MKHQSWNLISIRIHKVDNLVEGYFQCGVIPSALEQIRTVNLLCTRAKQSGRRKNSHAIAASERFWITCEDKYEVWENQTVLKLTI